MSERYAHDCPICGEHQCETRDLVQHILWDHPTSETAANVKIELALSTPSARVAASLFKKLDEVKEAQS